MNLVDVHKYTYHLKTGSSENQTAIPRGLLGPTGSEERELYIRGWESFLLSRYETYSIVIVKTWIKLGSKDNTHLKGSRPTQATIHPLALTAALWAFVSITA